MQPNMILESEPVVQADDVAIVYTKWSLFGSGSDGAAANMNGQAIDVML